MKWTNISLNEPQIKQLAKQAKKNRPFQKPKLSGGRDYFKKQQI